MTSDKTLSNSPDAIDAVYLWCDGSDPLFRKRKAGRFASLNIPYDEDDAGDLRFEENDELRYSVRSLFRHAPWIRHIWILTDRQRPAWLADHPKVTVVDHSAVLPASHIPTFNSNEIELYIHKIPGLCEKFLFLNDDMMFGDAVSPDFFFSGENPVIRLKREISTWQFKNNELIEKALATPKTADFKKNQLRAWLLSNRKYGFHEFLTLTHTVDAYTKSSFERALSTFPELLSENSSPFRNGFGIQRLLISYFLAFGENCPLRIIPPLSFAQKHLPFTSGTVESYEGTECDKVRRRIRKLKPKMFCLNTDIRMDPKNRQASRELFQTLFPEPSPCEKQ